MTRTSCWHRWSGIQLYFSKGWRASFLSSLYEFSSFKMKIPVCIQENHFIFKLNWKQWTIYKAQLFSEVPRAEKMSRGLLQSKSNFSIKLLRRTFPMLSELLSVFIFLSRMWTGPVLFLSASPQTALLPWPAEWDQRTEREGAGGCKEVGWGWGVVISSGRCQGFLRG